MEGTTTALARPRTHLCLLLDSSGSMAVHVADVRRSFQEFMAQQLVERFDHLFVTTCFFNEDQKFVSRDIPLHELSVPVIADTYRAEGDTALYDTVLTGIQAMESTVQQSGDRVVVVVFTDGADTVSGSPARDVKSAVRRKLENGRWTFIYVGPERGGAAVLGFPPANELVFKPEYGEHSTALALVSSHLQHFRRGEAMSSSDFFRTPPRQRPTWAK